MPSDSGYISVSSENRKSSTQWTPQHSLSLNDSSISAPMSKHIHSTTRRIFIGPTPLNWSYKKSSLWFSKSDKATHHKGPNRQRTFRAEPEVRGPTDMSSLDLYEASDDHNPFLARILDTPFLVSEPDEIPIDESRNSLFDDEIFYTPNEAISSFPTPPHYNRRNPKKLTQKNDIRPKSYFDTTKLLVDCIKEEGNAPLSSESSHPNNFYDDNEEIKSVHENDVNNKFLNDADHPVECVNSEDKSMSHPVYKPGTIIKEDRLLVRIEHLRYEGSPKRYSIHSLKNNTSRKPLTQSIGWREYIVRLRPGIMELYGSKETRLAKMRFTQATRLTLFSAIDYTLTLRQPSDCGTKVFIINPKTIKQSIEWYRILYATLEVPSIKQMPSLCEVYVPDLDVRVKIPLENYGHAHQITAEEVTKLVLDELSGEPEWEDSLREWLESRDLRLCWKRYDRLEWIVWEKNEEGKARNDLLACPQFIEGTHQLQLRLTEHYPTSVHLKDGTNLHEPPPVEGYLIRVTNDMGEWKPKRLYFASHDHYLFLLKPFEASPPPPPSSSACEGNQQPLIYSAAPQSQEQCAQTDAFMKADIRRRVKQILSATAFINLVNAVEVKSSSNVYGIAEMENHGCPFELVLDNDKIIILQAYSKQTADEWIKRLNELIKYWKARKMSDVQIRINTTMVNENISDNTNENELHNWNNCQAFANPTIWHWCTLNGCRGITKGGLLYHKSHIYGTFQNFHHILTNGHLLYYKLYTRNLLSGAAKQPCFHKRLGCINLADCYIYSGSITEHDSPYSSTSKFSAMNDGTHKLPRIYSDGMYSFDDDGECTFVIWQGRQKLYFGKDEKRKASVICLKKKTMLDHIGNIFVFRARTRMEKEEWVWTINLEIERALEKNKDG